MAVRAIRPSQTPPSFHITRPGRHVTLLNSKDIALKIITFKNAEAIFFSFLYLFQHHLVTIDIPPLVWWSLSKATTDF